MQHNSAAKSNYLAEVKEESCIACGLCMKRCPMDAIELKFSAKATNKFRKAVVVDTGLCVGCGVCVHKCKPKAVILKPKKIPTPPSDTFWDLAERLGLTVLDAKTEQKKHDKKVVIRNSIAKRGLSLGMSMQKKNPKITTWLTKKVANSASKRAHNKK